MNCTCESDAVLSSAHLRFGLEGKASYQVREGYLVSYDTPGSAFVCCMSQFCGDGWLNGCTSQRQAETEGFRELN